MRRTFAAFIAAIALTSALETSAADRNYLTGRLRSDQITEILIQKQAWVPYPAYSDRNGWDRLTGSCRADIIAAGEKYLDYEWKVIKMSDYLEYEKSGNRRIMEVPFDENNLALASLFEAELAEGSGRFILQIINGAIHTCEMTSWALSAHIHALGPERRAFPREDDTTLEITQGGVSQMMSWIYYYLHEEFDKIHPDISRRIKSEIVRRELDPYLRETGYWWMGYNPHIVLNNWNPWCNSNALLCFMLIEDDPERLAQGVWKTMWSVDQYLNRIQGDGGIEEGPSYWGHSAGMTYQYLSALRLATGGAVDIFGVDQIRGMGEYIVNSYVGDGWVVNFADASARGGASNLNLIYRFGKAVGSAPMTGYAAQMQKVQQRRPSPTADVFGFLESLSALGEMEEAGSGYDAPQYVWYPETQFHYARGSHGLFFAAKGGYNNESHNHNDVGSFILCADDLPVFIDAGVGTYTAKTFSEHRYDIWTMQSEYHNLPMINGTAQRNGTDFRARDVRSGRNTFSADIAGAYPEEAGVRSWVRSYTLKNGALDITDSFDLNEASAPNKVNFMTWGDVDISTPGIVRVSVQGREMMLKYNASSFTAVKETVTLDDRRLSDIWGPEIYRVSLTATKLQKKGTYRFSIVRQ